MNKVFLLGANKEIDRAKQVLEVNQVIQMKGYSYHKYVVYEITKNDWAITYKLIDLTTKDFNTADIVRPLSEKFGIGFYYDAENPTFLDASEVAILLQEAKQKKQKEDEAAEQERIRVEEVKAVAQKEVEKLREKEADFAEAKGKFFGIVFSDGVLYATYSTTFSSIKKLKKMMK